MSKMTLDERCRAAFDSNRKRNLTGSFKEVAVRWIPQGHAKRGEREFSEVVVERPIVLNGEP